MNLGQAIDRLNPFFDSSEVIFANQIGLVYNNYIRMRNLDMSCGHYRAMVIVFVVSFDFSAWVIQASQDVLGVD
jgi:hypothetical protein